MALTLAMGRGVNYIPRFGQKNAKGKSQKGLTKAAWYVWLLNILMLITFLINGFEFIFEKKDILSWGKCLQIEA